MGGWCGAPIWLEYGILAIDLTTAGLAAVDMSMAIYDGVTTGKWDGWRIAFDALDMIPLIEFVSARAGRTGCFVGDTQVYVGAAWAAAAGAVSAAGPGPGSWSKQVIEAGAGVLLVGIGVGLVLDRREQQNKRKKRQELLDEIFGGDDPLGDDPLGDLFENDLDWPDDLPIPLGPPPALANADSPRYDESWIDELHRRQWERAEMMGDSALEGEASREGEAPAEPEGWDVMDRQSWNDDDTGGVAVTAPKAIPRADLTKPKPTLSSKKPQPANWLRSSRIFALLLVLLGLGAQPFEGAPGC